MPARRPRFGSLSDPMVAAVADGLFRFRTPDEARDRIKALARTFIISRKHPLTADSLVLWIKEYGVTPEEEAKGYLGHYARVTIQEINGKWTLGAEKLPMALRNHPQRKYLTDNAHPNWGHPILRAIKKKKPFPTADAAQEALMVLHEQYPQASIPGNGRLYLMIYGKPPYEGAAAEKPLHKYVFKIRALAEGGCIIEGTLNDRRARKPPAKIPEPAAAEGFFSTMVKARRGLRQPKPEKRPQASDS